MNKTNAAVALFLAAIALGAQTLFAQSADGDATTEASTESTTTASSKQTAGTKAENKSGPEAKTGSKSEADDKAFIPSEEISEDFAVSFPVDI